VLCKLVILTAGIQVSDLAITYAVKPDSWSGYFSCNVKTTKAWMYCGHDLWNVWWCSWSADLSCRLLESECM